MTLLVRQARPADIDQIMAVEQDWDESQRAGRDKMLGRLRTYPDGFLLFEQDGVVIGTQMSFPMRYVSTEVSQLHDWDTVTNDGYYPEIDMSTANAIYLASGSLRRSARGSTAYTLMMQAPVDLARRLGLDYVVAGAKIPGYDAYCRRFGDIDARDYAFLELNGSLADPLLEMYRHFGYHVPDRDHVVADYYPDPPSRDYAAIVVRTVR